MSANRFDKNLKFTREAFHRKSLLNSKQIMIKAMNLLPVLCNLILADSVSKA
jgi:hypothetical protein